MTTEEKIDLLPFGIIYDSMLFKLEIKMDQGGWYCTYMNTEMNRTMYTIINKPTIKELIDELYIKLNPALEIIRLYNKTI